MTPRPFPFPPDVCSAETMAYLLDMSVTTFESYVKAGLLPQGIRLKQGPNTVIRWNRLEVVARWDSSGNPEPMRRDKGSGDIGLEGLKRQCLEREKAS